MSLKLQILDLQSSIKKSKEFSITFRKQFVDIRVGSLIYMSPECVKHNVYGPKSDVWAFGIFIYEILHGKTPYTHCKS
jgi:serine/threonine protein kinase